LRAIHYATNAWLFCPFLLYQARGTSVAPRPGDTEGLSTLFQDLEQTPHHVQAGRNSHDRQIQILKLTDVACGGDARHCKPIPISTALRSKKTAAPLPSLG